MHTSESLLAKTHSQGFDIGKQTHTRRAQTSGELGGNSCVTQNYTF